MSTARWTVEKPKTSFMHHFCVCVCGRLRGREGFELGIRRNDWAIASSLCLRHYLMSEVLMGKLFTSFSSLRWCVLSKLLTTSSVVDDFGRNSIQTTLCLSWFFFPKFFPLFFVRFVWTSNLICFRLRIRKGRVHTN